MEGKLSLGALQLTGKKLMSITWYLLESESGLAPASRQRQRLSYALLEASCSNSTLCSPFNEYRAQRQCAILEANVLRFATASK